MAWTFFTESRLRFSSSRTSVSSIFADLFR
jgi:hypothetical protein